MWFTTPPLDIIDAPADHRHYSVALPLVPRRIVLHSTQGTNSLGHLTHDSTPPVSVHRLIDRQGQIYKIVPDNAIAFHVGFSTLFPYPHHGLTNANYTSLGIELENLNNGKEAYPREQLLSCVAQILEWYGAYGYLPVVSHADLDPRKRDLATFDWETFMGMVWKRLTGILDNVLS